MTQRYGEIEGSPIYLLDRATAELCKAGQICIQSLLTGETAIVDQSAVTGITTVYPTR